MSPRSATARMTAAIDGRACACVAARTNNDSNNASLPRAGD